MNKDGRGFWVPEYQTGSQTSKTKNKEKKTSKQTNKKSGSLQIKKKTNYLTIVFLYNNLQMLHKDIIISPFNLVFGLYNCHEEVLLGDGLERV